MTTVSKFSGRGFSLIDEGSIPILSDRPLIEVQSEVDYQPPNVSQNGFNRNSRFSYNPSLHTKPRNWTKPEMVVESDCAESCSDRGCMLFRNHNIVKAYERAKELEHDLSFKENRRNFKNLKVHTEYRQEKEYIEQELKEIRITGPANTPTISTDENIYTKPPITPDLTDGELEYMTDLIVGHMDIGWVKFLGVNDVRGLDLDKIVRFEEGQISVYADDAPPVGEELNGPAIICIYVKTERGKKYEEKLRKLSEKQGTEFCRYDPDNGMWLSKVDHF